MGYWRARRALTGRLRQAATSVRAGAIAPLSEGRVLAKLFTGERLLVPADDLSVTPVLLANGIWEPAFSRLFLSLLRPDSVVLDVGANAGYYTVIGGGTVVSGRLCAVEANPRLARLIEQNVYLNGMQSRASVANVAITDRSGGTVALRVPEGVLGGATLRDFEGLASEVEVEAITIDDLCRREGIGAVDVIKMDIEGLEQHAYAGMRHTVEQSPRLALMLEFSGTAYDDPAGFVGSLVADFERVWWLDPRRARRRRVRSVADLPPKAFDDWVLLLATRGRGRWIGRRG